MTRSGLYESRGGLTPARTVTGTLFDWNDFLIRDMGVLNVFISRGSAILQFGQIVTGLGGC